MSDSRTGKAVAVILAAGEGRRMGTPKATLEFSPGLSFLDQLERAFERAGCEVLAVLGKEADAIRALHPGVLAVENEDWADGQFGSAKVGMAEALALGAELILICPVDQPAVTPETIAAVRQGLEGADAAVPALDGRTGHPLVITAAAAGQVLAMNDAPHLEAALAALTVAKVPVADDGALRDFDTPEEYAAHFGHPPRVVQRGG